MLDLDGSKYRKRGGGGWNENLLAQDALARFQGLESYYVGRNAALTNLDAFFDGTQWAHTESENAEVDKEREIVRTTLNYARMAVMRNTALLTASPPRVDVHGDQAARARETFLRSIMTSTGLWRVWAEKIEMNAAKLSYAVLQVTWDARPERVRRETIPAPAAEGASPAVPREFSYLRSLPIRFRSVPPDRFYPVYSDSNYDDPDEFLYAFKVTPDRHIDAIEKEYKVRLAPTGAEPIPGESGSCEVIEYWDNDWYLLFAVTKEVRKDNKGDTKHAMCYILEGPTRHNYGRVPFFVVQNIPNPDKNPTLEGSISDVELIMDANKHLNLINTLVATSIAKNVEPPTVYKSDDGWEKLKDIRMGSGEVIPIRTTEELEPITWAGLPETVSRHLSDTIRSLEDLGNLSHSALAGDQPMSGVGQRLSYANTELILALKINPRVHTLQAVLSFCLRLCDTFLKDNEVISYSQMDRLKSSANTTPSYLEVNLRKKDIQGAYTCYVTFPNIMPRDKMTHEQHMAYLYAQGILPLLTVLEQLDFVADPYAVMDELRRETDDIRLNPERFALLQNAKKMQAENQAPPPTPTTPPGAGALMGAVQSGMGGPGAGLTSVDRARRNAGVIFNSAPSVPVTPEMPTSSNAPMLQRGAAPNAGQMFGAARPGQFVGPPIEET